MMMNGEMWTQLGSMVAGLMFIWAMFQQYVPFEFRGYFHVYSQKIFNFVYPYIQITFHEYGGDGFQRSRVFTSIQTYLSANSSSRAKRLKADVMRDSQALVLSMDDNEEVTDEFKGIKLWWTSRKSTPRTQSISWYPNEDEKRYYMLTFHKKYRDIITSEYLSHVMEQGKAIAVKKRQRKLYTNSKGESMGYRRKMWTSVHFEHPATFDTLALEPNKKKEIINDLKMFTKSKDYYKKIGKAWKRGYLLFGPPGTGKSTMIAAMANLLEYDVYDLELTEVKDNTELRKLLIDTTGKSIIVIEDIDCSLDLTGQRKKKEEDDKEKDPKKKAKSMEAEKLQDSKVTLSGLLNFIDGLWSACGGERIIVFTTNFVEKLDPALIRRGRMDKHVELSYCGFEVFKVLARNYLDLESHELFVTIRNKLKETNITPADVAENLMPKCGEEDAESCLENLIKALEKANEDAKLKDEEEERLKAEKEMIKALEKAKEDAKLKAEEEERLKVEKEEKDKIKALEKAKEDAKLKAEEEERLNVDKEEKEKIKALEKAKEDAKLKAEEEERLKAEKEEKEKIKALEKAKEDAKLKAEEEERLKAVKADKEEKEKIKALEKAKEDAKLKAEEEQRLKAEKEKEKDKRKRERDKEKKKDWMRLSP